MSDRENTPGPIGNSPDRQTLEEKTPSADGSLSHPVEEERRSRSRSRTRSRSPSFRRRRSYSRSSKTNENAEEVESEGQRSHSRGHRYKHYSRSRSHSPRHRKYSRSRSRSRSYSPRRSYSPQYSPRRSYYDDYYKYGGKGGSGGGSSGGRYSRHNRSPMSSRQRHVGNRDNPEPSRCLGIFGLSLYTLERELRDILGKYGPIEDVQVVYDAQSGRSRGFAFVYFENTDDAKMAKERCNGTEIDGRKLRVDYSITKRAHTPTPGIYMGKPAYSPKFGGHREGGGSSYRNHSPSPYYNKRRYSRSRSRSYSPRKYGYH